MESRPGEPGAAGVVDGRQETRNRRETGTASSRRSTDVSRKGGNSNRDDEASDVGTRIGGEERQCCLMGMDLSDVNGTMR